MMITTLMILAGCKGTTVDQYGNTRNTIYGLVEVKELISDEAYGVAYDPETKVCYILFQAPYKSGASPYYIINDNGLPEIAIYGVNYFGD